MNLKLKHFTFFTAFVSGCSFQTAQDVFPEIAARQPPAMKLGLEISLLNTPVTSTTSLISTDNKAHVFAIDSSNQVQHLEIYKDIVEKQEVIGSLSNSQRITLDAIEHPLGKIRIAAGDRQFIRSTPNSTWQEISDNRCVRFLIADENLFCGFVINGKEIDAPKRKDVTIGLFILVPVVYWSNEQAEKLVLAQEINNQWSIRAVFDSYSVLDANNDFFLQVDNKGILHALYYASRGGGAWAFLVGYMAAGFFSTEQKRELKYTKIPVNRLSLSNEELTDVDINTSSKWFSAPGIILPLFSFKNLSPLNRHFTINSTSGELVGMTDIIRARGTNSFFQWVNIGIRDNNWIPKSEIVSVNDIPNNEYSHYSFPIIRNDLKGNSHVIMRSCTVGWGRKCVLNYFQRTDNKWSAPLTLGGQQNITESTISTTSSGDVFAAWINEKGNFIGRWIRRVDNNLN